MAASAKLHNAETRYTLTEGISAVRKAIVRHTEEHYRQLVDPENIILSTSDRRRLSKGARIAGLAVKGIPNQFRKTQQPLAIAVAGFDATYDFPAVLWERLGLTWSL